MTESETRGQSREEQVERKLAVPVIIAALVSVPAMFLTTLEGPAAQVGTMLNWASLAVLTGESVLLFWAAGDRVRWLKENRALVAIVLITVPAVVFAVGPAQLLRLVRFVGALRVIRVNRILKAGRILRTRADLDGVWRNTLAFGITLLAAVFVALVLADPTSQTRLWAERLVGRFGIAPIILAGLILAVATFVVARNRATGLGDDEAEEEARDSDGRG